MSRWATSGCLCTRNTRAGLQILFRLTLNGRTGPLPSADDAADGDCPAHNSHEAERLQLGERLRFARHDCEGDAIWRIIALCIPTKLAQLVDVRRHHALDRLQRATLAGHVDLNAVTDVTLRDRKSTRLNSSHSQ